jgi:Flp pilus assembly protein TadG
MRPPSVARPRPHPCHPPAGLPPGAARPSTRRCHGEHGGALVEAALAFPLLTALLVGMVTAGLAYNQKLSLTQATREAARYGSTIPSSQAFSSGTWATNVRTMLIARAAGELGVPGATVCVALVQGSPAAVVSPAANYSTSGAPCDATETYPVTADDIGRRVQVSVTRPAEIETGFVQWDLTLTSASTAKSESDK